MKTGMGKMILQTAGALLIWLLLIYLYTLFHEGGHALVAIMYGGRIDSFVLGFGAHIVKSGTNFTPVGESLFYSAGVLLPALSLAVALKFYNRRVKSLIFHYIYAAITIMIIGSFFAWLVIPVMSLFTEPPPGDDVSRFLEISGLNPLLVSLIALLLMFLLALIAYKKGLYTKIREHLNFSLQIERIKLKKTQTVGLVLVIILFGLVVFGAYQMLQPNKVFETSFSMEVHDVREVVEMPFKVEVSKSHNMSLKLDAEGMLTDVRIYDEKGNTIYQNICEWFTLSTSLDLKSGDYLFTLTFLRDPDAMSQYFAEKGYKFSPEQINEFNEILNKNRDNKSIPVSFSAIIR